MSCGLCHKMLKKGHDIYDICHKAKNVMKYVNMGIKRTVSIRQNKLGLSNHSPEKNWEKIQKTKKENFSLYLLSNSFVK